MLGHSQHRHIPVVQLHWITQHFVSTVYLMGGKGGDGGWFCYFVSAAMDFMVALGKRLKPCHIQEKKIKKKDNTSLESLVFGTNSSCLLNSASGQAGTRLQQEVLPSARPGWAREAGSSNPVFSENRFLSEPCLSALNNLRAAPKSCAVSSQPLIGL